MQPCFGGETVRAFLLLFSFIWAITGCSDQEEQHKNDLETAMGAVFSYKLNKIEEEHKDKVNKWLAEARETAEEGQYYIFQESINDYMYSYVYRKGYTQYEVSFIYNPGDPTIKGRVYVTGNNKDLNHDNFVQIKSIDDLSILFVLSDEGLSNKLK